MKKLVSLILALLMAAGLMSTALADVTAQEWSLPIVEQPIEVTGYCLQSPQGGIGNEMIAWQKYAEWTGIKVDWTDVPTDNQAETLNILFASGDLPDIIYACGLDNNTLVKYGSAGMFADLTEAYEKNAYWLQKVIEENPSLEGGLRMADGKIYAFPHLKLGDNMLTNKLFVNPNWLKAVGKEMPTNFQEFEDMLYAFRDNDANEDGDPNNEIPFIIRYNDYHFLPILYTFFGLGNRGTGHRYVDWDYENNCLRFIPTSKEFKDPLTVVHKWYEDKLIDPETFQNTSSKQIVAKTTQGIVGAHGDFVTNTGSVYQDIFRCIPVMENYYGNKAYTRRSQMIASLGAFVVSGDSKYVDELVKWADYFYSPDGQILYNMGIEGVTFEFDENGKPQWKDEMIHDPNGLTLTQKRVQYMGFQSGCGAWTDETYQGAETYWTSTELMDEYRPYLPEEVWELFSPTPEEAEEMDYLWTDIQNYLNENIAKFITGDRSLDEWDKYVADIQNMDIARYMEIYTAMYNRYKGN